MNISIEENIVKIQNTIAELSREQLRLEGSLRTLLSMKEMGITTIEVKNENLMETKEVVENVHG